MTTNQTIKCEHSTGLVMPITIILLWSHWSVILMLASNWPGQNEYSWPYDQNGLLTADQAITFDWPGHEFPWSHWTINHWLNCSVNWPGHDEYPWPYDQTGLLTADQAISHETALVMLNILDHMTKLGYWWTTHSTGLVMMDSLDHMSTFDC